jgi:hypothetical protein
LILGAVLLPLWNRSPFAPAREKLRSLGIPYSPDGLVQSVYARNLDAVRLFHEAGFPMNAWDARNEFALGAAAAADDLAQVRFLIDLDCNLEQTSGWGNTALAIAARGARLDIVALLVERGARVNAMDDLGFTPLDHAIEPRDAGGWVKVPGTPDATIGQRRAVIEFLRKHNALTGAEIRNQQGQGPAVVP